MKQPLEMKRMSCLILEELGRAVFVSIDNNPKKYQAPFDHYTFETVRDVKDATCSWCVEASLLEESSGAAFLPCLLILTLLN